MTNEAPPTIQQLVRLDAHLMTADSRSIRWLYERYNGFEQFTESIRTSAGVDGLLRFFENEPDILAQIDNDEEFGGEYDY